MKDFLAGKCFTNHKKYFYQKKQKKKQAVSTLFWKWLRILSCGNKSREKEVREKQNDERLVAV